MRSGDQAHNAERLHNRGMRWLRPLMVVGGTAYVVPFLGPFLQTGTTPGQALLQTSTPMISLVSALAALLMFHRVTAYPGARAFSYIIPAFSTTFGLATTLLLITRTPYSGAMLLLGYVGSVAVSFLLGYLDQRTAPKHMYFIRQGNVDIIDDAPQIDWIELADPEIPLDDEAAIVADLRADLSDAWERMLAEAALAGIPVYHTKQLRESLTGRVQIEHLSENSFGSLLPALSYRGIKRVIDTLACIVLIPLLLVPMLCIALGVRLSSRGPVFFRQQRMGYRGTPFWIAKFRTMHLAEHGMGHASTDMLGSAMTQAQDPRITRIGGFLRRSRLDELPQIINILQGEMSWIGPRPEALPLADWYGRELPFYSYRHIVRPGITGWAQVNQGHVTALDDAHAKLHYDFYYIKNFSIWLDALIMLRTFSVMLTGFGAK